MPKDNNLKILLENKTLKECNDFMKNNSEEMYLVPGGYEVKGITLFGVVSSVGFSGNDIIFRYMEPTSVYFFSVFKLEDEAEEIRKLREQYKTDTNVKKIK
jgi:hypothetical protein